VRSAKERPGFAVNTLWTWASVAANILMAVFVTRLLVRRLGAEAYGLWAIVFGLVDYFWFLDLGMRAAVVKYVAEHRALGHERELVKTLNAAFLYYFLVGTVMLGVTWVLAARSPQLVVMSPRFYTTFASMVLVTGCGWAINAVFVSFAASLEAIQRFDLSYRIMIAVSVVRVLVIVVLLESGFGLLEVVIAAVGSQLLQTALLWGPFRRHFPEFHWHFWDIDRATLSKMFRFGVHVVPSTIGALLLVQGPSVVIGYAWEATFAGYYVLPRRLVQSFLELVYRLGSVTTARASELAARRDRDALVNLGIESNRYSLAIFLPVAVFFGIYGDALLTVWLGPGSGYAAISAPLLPVFLLGVLAEASQMCSGATLYGLGRHQVFAWLLLLEGAAAIGCVYVFSAQHNLMGAAIATSALMVLNRGIVTPTLLCRELKYPVMAYVGTILIRPLTIGLVAALATIGLRLTVLPGKGLVEVAIAGACSVGLYLILAGRYLVFPHHQDRIIARVRVWAPALGAPFQWWLGTGRRVGP
jgi:O-antigen/teichoic acid export membrane protein